MAAAFNLPMLSYYCQHAETSDKVAFPTFLRTRWDEKRRMFSFLNFLFFFILAKKQTKAMFIEKAHSSWDGLPLYDRLIKNTLLILCSNSGMFEKFFRVIICPSLPYWMSLKLSFQPPRLVHIQVSGITPASLLLDDSGTFPSFSTGNHELKT